MAFYPPPYPIPQILPAQHFVLLPLSTRHVQIDYEAVMSSRDMLHLWSGSRWPAEDFTLAQNLVDLDIHEQEHMAGEAFTFTILDPDRQHCLGCLYIRPLAELVNANYQQLADVGEHEAMARFWVRASLLAREFDKSVLSSVRRWFLEDWHFPTLYFHTRSANHQQIALFDGAGLERSLTLRYPGRGGSHHFYGAHTAP